ncbi:restriction endonuclease subunit S [Lentilactobacillus parabuchneri]
MKDNQAKYPQLRFKGFTDPWEQRKLGNLGLNISDGDWIEKQHIFENGQYRIIQTGNIGVDEYLDKPQNAKYFRQEDFNQLKANEIFPGDIVVCRLADPAGRAVILPNIGKQMVTSVDVAILRPSSRISFRFLVSQLNNPRNLKQVQIMASGSTRTRISRKNLEREIIQLPNINEQKKIGSFFSILNSTIALHQRKLAKLKELKQGYLQKLFPKNGSKFPQLRFAGFADAWEERKLVSMTNYKNGKGHEDKQSTIGKLELINLNSISISGGLKHSGKFIDEADDTLQKDDLVMILSDVGHGDLLGRVALIPEDDRFVLNQRVALLRPNATADPQFLFSYINAHQYYFKAQGAGMSQLNISKGSVENFISFVPIIEEQKKIGTFFKQLDNTITLHQRKLEKLQELKKGYLQKMFC